MTTQALHRRRPRVQRVNSGRRISAAGLREIQCELGVTLPLDYRRFLTRHNGGTLRPNAFIMKRRGEWVSNWVQALGPWTSSKIDSLNLRGLNQGLARCRAAGSVVPWGAVSIGYDGCDNDLLLATSGRYAGQVWLKWWDDEDSDSSRRAHAARGLYRLATSFNTFLDQLTAHEVADASAASRNTRTRGP